jgi:hypothetical protein
LAAACAVVCCSLPLLVAAPSLTLAIGWLAGAFEIGMTAAIPVVAVVSFAAIVWRRRRGACSGCPDGCRCGGGREPGLLQVQKLAEAPLASKRPLG